MGPPGQARQNKQVAAEKRRTDKRHKTNPRRAGRKVQCELEGFDALYYNDDGCGDLSAEMSTVEEVPGQTPASPKRERVPRSAAVRAQQPVVETAAAEEDEGGDVGGGGEVASVAGTRASADTRTETESAVNLESHACSTADEDGWMLL